MALTFANVHLRKQDSFSKMQAHQIADLLVDGRYFQPISDSANADIMISIYCPKESPWVTIVSDMFADDFSKQTLIAHRLSNQFLTDVLCIGCFDSDYLFLNLINARDGVDLWAASGSAQAMGGGMRRSNYSAWTPYVEEPEAFRRVMKGRHVFAESVLPEIEPMLGFEPNQSSLDGINTETEGEWYPFYFKASVSDTSSKPPVFKLWHAPYYQMMDGVESLLTIMNTGGSAKGLWVAFSGEGIEQGAVSIDMAGIQVNEKNGEWAYYPLPLEMKMFPDGHLRLVGEMPQMTIREAALDGLPQGKKERMAFQRGISLRFIPHCENALTAKKLLQGVGVTFVPQQNPQGQCTWIGQPSDTEHAL